MKTVFLKSSIPVLFLLTCSLCFSQETGVTIRFIANCGLHFTDGTDNIYVDFPYKSGAHNYMEFDDSELDNIQANSVFIFTHKHADHYSKKNLKQVLKSKKGASYGAWNISEMENLATTLTDFSIQTYKTEHSFSSNHYSYLITWHGRKIFLSGDTETADTAAQMKDLDWAFVPAWLLKDAYDRNLKLDSKMIGVYHIGPRDKINITGDKILMMTEKGKVIEL